MTMATLEAALRTAILTSITRAADAEPGDMKRRSAQFVSALAVALRDVDTKDVPREEIVGLARGLNDQAQRKGFLLTELLWDAAVVRASLEGHRRRVVGCLWAVESELAPNFTEVQKDLNKLIVAASRHRLMVVSQSVVTLYLQAMREWCAEAGVHCWVAGVEGIGMWPVAGLSSLKLLP